MHLQHEERNRQLEHVDDGTEDGGIGQARDVNALRP